MAIDQASSTKSGRTRLPDPPGFPVIWEDGIEPTLLWSWDNFHTPLPPSTMTVSAGEASRKGMTREAKESGRYRPGGRRKFINGYPFNSNGPPSADDETRKAVEERQIDKAIPNVLARWNECWRPRLEADLAEMKSVDLQSASSGELWSTIERFIALNTEHWAIHHKVVMPTIVTSNRLTEALKEIMGEDAPAHLLLNGTRTKTVEAIEGIDALAEAATSDDRVSEILQSASEASQARPLLERIDAGCHWLGLLDAYMDEFGYRPGGFDFMFPTWIEDPSIAYSLIATRLRNRPAEKPQNDVLAERNDLLEQARAKAASDPALLDRLDSAYAAAEEIWFLKEDHSYYIDQASVSLVRIALAEAGRRLASDGILSEPSNVWFINLDEARDSLLGNPPTGLDALANKRRAERDRNARLTPPRFLGTAPAGHEAETMAGTDPVSAVDGLIALRGTAASRGAATGTARVVLSPDQFRKVRDGDILICRSTAPMWTPLFRMIAGLVAESGGVLSHPAVVAREVGLPAVVGVADATTLIHDGDVVTVSGTDGVVSLNR